MGIEKYPPCSPEFFRAAMESYETKGCELTDPAYYDRLEETYGCLGEYLCYFKEAARLVAEDEKLTRFLVLLEKWLREYPCTDADLIPLSNLKVPEGGNTLAYEMVTGLALCSQVENTAGLLRKRGLPEELIGNWLTSPIRKVRDFKARHNGRMGYDRLWWSQRNMKGNLFSMGRLDYELGKTFTGQAVVFQHESGELCVLANGMKLHRDGHALGAIHFTDEEGSWEACIEETEEGYRGYPYRTDSLVDHEAVFLPKAQWKKILSPGDPVVALHIPMGGNLKPEFVDASLEEAKTFLNTYFPDVEYKAFTCGSWLMDPQLQELAGQKSNIAHFNRRFFTMTTPSAGRGVFSFVFLKMNNDFELADLPENTRLERALKNHYLAGKAVYELNGFMLT